MVEDVNITEATTPTDTGVTDGGQVSTETPAIDTSVQPEGTAVGTTEQPLQATESVDLSKIDPSTLTAEQVAELQQGYLRQSDYTKKTQELSHVEKESFTDYITKPENQQEIADWISSNTPVEVNSETNMQNVIQSWGRMNQQQQGEYYNNLDDNQKMMFSTAMKADMADKQLRHLQLQQMDANNAKTYGETYNKLLPEVNKRFATRKPFDSAEVFKSINYEAYGKQQFELGKMEALKNRQGVRQTTGSGGLGTTVPAGGTARERMLAALDGMPDLPKQFR